MTNVLLQTWNAPFRIAPFDAISDSDFAPALDVALTRHRAEIDTIATASTPATCLCFSARKTARDAVVRVGNGRACSSFESWKRNGWSWIGGTGNHLITWM